jgi:hypothetical protein
MDILELSGAERDQRAEYPLGVIRARGLITETEHLAGLEYARLHRQVEHPKSPHSCLAQLIPSGEGAIATAVDPRPETEALYRQLRETVRQRGSRAWRQLQNVVIYAHWPRFLDTARKRPPMAWLADEADLAALRSALDALARELAIRSRQSDPVAELRDSVASFCLRRAWRHAEPVGGAPP